MSPAKKRHIQAKQAAETLAKENDAMEVDAVAAPTSTDVDLTPKLQKLHEETMSTLQSNLDLLQGTPAGVEREELIFSCSVALSTLKLLQRQISLQVENHHAAVATEERSKVESCSLMLENLNYERNYLRREIAELRGWKAEHLEKMCCDELGLDMNALGKEASNVTADESGDVDMTDGAAINSPDEAIDTHIFGDSQKSHRDPSNHETVLAKLQEDRETRSSLVEELSKSKMELKNLQDKKEELRNFLMQIPKKLNEMEKVGESLAGFFTGCKAEWLCNEDEGATAETKLAVANTLACPPSLKRADRFQLAQCNLASPLYALFVQLAGYIDAWSMVEHLNADERDAVNLREFVGANGMNVEAVSSNEGEDSTWTVELNLSTANILPPETSTLIGRSSKAGGDPIKIVFSYDTVQGVVMAQVVNENKSATDGDLLDNLFPGDDGSLSPNVPSALAKSDEEEIEIQDQNKVQDSDVQNDSSSRGKPYHWCQVLSGLNFPPASSRESTGIPIQANVCTKAVFRQLLRRIRARRSLAALLDCLARRPQNLPIHPAFRTEESSSVAQTKAKVISWTEEKDNQNVSYSPSMKRYIATIKRKTSTLKAAVLIDMQNYPAEPPIWSLQNEDGTTTGSASSWGDQNGDMASLKDDNGTNSAPPLFDATLHRIENHVNTDLDQFVTQEVEATYDWILIHQLMDILSCWDEMMNAAEGNVNGNKGGKTKGFDSGRLRKGKDRRLVGFGSQSPFFYYRQGLETSSSMVG